MATSEQTIPKDKFLLIAINLLHRQFVAGGRTPAKRLFREILEGKTVPITAVTMEDESTVRFQLCLDHSEHKGHLNFSLFRGGLTTLLANISMALEDERDVTVFSMEQRAGSVLFGITAVTVEGDQTSVMVLGTDSDDAGVVTLRLVYLDPKQFSQQDQAPATTSV